MDSKNIWQGTSMIIQPDLVTAELVARACEQVKKKKEKQV